MDRARPASWMRVSRRVNGVLVAPVGRTCAVGPATVIEVPLCDGLPPRPEESTLPGVGVGDLERYAWVAAPPRWHPACRCRCSGAAAPTVACVVGRRVGVSSRGGGPDGR